MKPVVVASNNDGCIVSRSNEAKALGIPMGAPAFKWRDVIDRHQVKIFSGNFPLYGDMSRRVMNILSDSSPEIEIYSIDEAFLDLSGISESKLREYALELKRKIYKWVGIPVSIGIGKTKTLSKAAVEIAKKHPEFENVMSAEQSDFDDWLAKLPVGDIWGIGRSYSQYLQKYGVFNAKQFKYSSPEWVKSKMKVMGQRTLLELRGIQCIDFSTHHEPRKGIVSSRTFGTPISELEDLKQAVSLYATRAAERLRKDGSVASVVQVSVTTNFHRKDLPQYHNAASIHLAQPSAYTPDLIYAAERVVERIYKPGYQYKKAYVYLTGISPDNQIQLNLFNEFKSTKRDKKLMKAVDVLNRKWERTTLQYASSGIRKKRNWNPNMKYASQRFTTSWTELPIAFAN